MDIFIESAKRTPIGNYQGGLSPLSAIDLGSHAIKSLTSTEGADSVVMGCVLPAGLGQAPARQAALKAAFPQSIHCATVNKVCGSGLFAIMTGWSQLLTGLSKKVIAGGMESMTNAPYLLAKARGGYRVGHDRLFDHMMLDGLEDAYHFNGINRFPMGYFADETAIKYAFTREDQDNYTIRCIEKAQKAVKEGWFANEIAEITIPNKKGDIIITNDEPPSKGNIAKIPTLKPAFRPDGTVTPASSSPLTDGAAAVCLTTKDNAHNPMAVIKGFAMHSHEPEWFTTAPIFAIEKLLKNIGWSVGDVDLFEINEAFAVVAMSAIKHLSIPEEKVNVHGGACALGHPIGASGARLVVTLVHALKKYGLKRGVAALCIGGGEGIAIAVENCA